MCHSEASRSPKESCGFAVRAAVRCYRCFSHNDGCVRRRITVARIEPIRHTLSPGCHEVRESDAEIGVRWSSSASGVREHLILRGFARATVPRSASSDAREVGEFDLGIKWQPDSETSATVRQVRDGDRASMCLRDLARDV